MDISWRGGRAARVARPGRCRTAGGCRARCTTLLLVSSRRLRTRSSATSPPAGGGGRTELAARAGAPAAVRRSGAGRARCSWSSAAETGAAGGAAARRSGGRRALARRRAVARTSGLRAARRAARARCSQARRWPGPSCARPRRLARRRLTDDALVVVDELVANAVLHAGTEIELRFALQDDRLGVAVADRSPTRPSSAAEGPPRRPGPAPGRRARPVLARAAPAWRRQGGPGGAGRRRRDRLRETAVSTDVAGDVSWLGAARCAPP